MISPRLSRREILRCWLGGLTASLFAVATFGVLGCQQESQSSATGSSVPAGESAAGLPPKPEGAFKIGLITPGSTKTDKAWSGLAWEGVQNVAKETGATVTPPVEGPDAASVAGALRNLAQEGDQLIFLHGSEYDEAASSIAPDFPKTTFVVVGGRTEKPNLTPINFSAGGAVYLAGMVAGSMTKTNKIACVGGSEIPIVKEAFENFAEGAKSVNPAADVRVVFTGDEKDIAKAKQQTQALLGEGVDVVQHNANDAGRGVAQAVEGKPGTYFMGANADQSDLATKQNLGSFVLDVPSAYLAVGKRVAEGKGDGKAVKAGLAEHAVYFKFNDRFGGTIPQEVKDKVAAAEKDIIAGKVAIKK
ncbi:MAG: BMP family protein [Akkermansiaceae bacterium]|nr:BMP family protein [Armatimonadota bacterium]